MKLIKITKGGVLHFELSDGRTGATYPSGYVRVSTKSDNYYHKKRLMYQINKRELIPNHVDRVRKLLEFNNKNCK